MATFSYSRDGQVLFIRTPSQHGVEMPLAFCAAGFIILGLATVALAEPAVGVMMMILGLACLAVLFVDTRLHIRRSGDLRLRHTLFGLFVLGRRTFAAGTWKVNVVQDTDWDEGVHPWQFVIEGEGRSAVLYAFPRKQGAVRLRQRILAFVNDSPL